MIQFWYYLIVNYFGFHDLYYIKWEPDLICVFMDSSISAFCNSPFWIPKGSSVCCPFVQNRAEQNKVELPEQPRPRTYATLCARMYEFFFSVFMGGGSDVNSAVFLRHGDPFFSTLPPVLAPFLPVVALRKKLLPPGRKEIKVRQFTGTVIGTEER